MRMTVFAAGLSLSLLFSASCSAQTENNWPRQGFTAYRIPQSNGDELIIRGSANNYASRMKLNSTGADYHNPSNITSSIVFEDKNNVRFGFEDINKNGIRDGVSEDFQNYSTGTNPNSIPNLNMKVFGLEYTDAAIKESGSNKYLRVNFSSPVNPNTRVWVPFGISQKSDFAIPIDLSGNKTIEFDIRTNLPNAIQGVMTVQITAKATHPDNDGDLGYVSWRLKNYYGAPTPWWKDTPGLYELPAGSAWHHVVFNVDDLVYNSTNERHWYKPDFSNVIKCEILFLQVPINDSSTYNDWEAVGRVDIDNFTIGSENQIASQSPLDTELTLLGVYSGSALSADFHPGEKVTVKLKARKSGANVVTSTSLKVFNPQLSWPSDISGSIIYDSTTAGEDISSVIGNGEEQVFSFSFWLPKNALTGQYRILGSISENSASSPILDTTGPDKSLDDLTILAYKTAFNVLPYTGNGPVAIFEPQPEVVPISANGVSEFILDASKSFHLSSPSSEIIKYEWDLENDGVFEHITQSPVFSVSHVNPSSPESYSLPIVLRVTDNSLPVQTAKKTMIVTFNKKGNIKINIINLAGSLKAMLYNSNHTYMGQSYDRLPDSSNIISWDNLPTGDYYIEVHEYNNSIFDGTNLRIMKKIAVSGTSPDSLPLSPNTPYISSVDIMYADNDTPINPLKRIDPGTEAKVNVKITNPSDMPMECRIKLVTDRNKDAFYDIVCPESASNTILHGEYAVISAKISPRKPSSSIETHYYAVRLDTNINNFYKKTQSLEWQQLYVVNTLPLERELYKTVDFSGHKWNVLNWAWQSGLSHKNVSIDNDGKLSLKVNDFSGVGGQIDSVRGDYHYGSYFACMQAPGIPTVYPEGSVVGFFYYWENEDATEFQEIDVELSSLHTNIDVDNDGNFISHVAFTVHNKKAEDGTSWESITYFCPVKNIDKPHFYGFKWTPNSVVFYIDGEIAVNTEGKQAIVNGTNFAERIPSQPGHIIFNQWCASKANSLIGEPPQCKGDFIARAWGFSYKPEYAEMRLSLDNEGIPIVKIMPYFPIMCTISIINYPIGEPITQIGPQPLYSEYIYTDTNAKKKYGRRYIIDASKL